MLFAFHGIRMLQLIMALGALATGVGAVVAFKVFTDGGSGWYVFLALFLGLAFLTLFGWALRAPTSYVAVAPERTRIRYGSFFDRVIDNRDIVSVRLRRWAFWRGLGVRTSFRGEVALVAAWGTCAEVTLREPVRVWLIPKLIPVRATRLVLSIRNPEKLVERFATNVPESPSPRRTSKVKHRGSRTR
jgi:hypothetical protein